MRTILTLLISSVTLAVFGQIYNLNVNPGNGAPGAANWTVPAGVFCIQVECWGGGGNGGRSNSAGQATGGGGGGAYARLDYLAVTPGQVIPYFIGGGGIGTGGASNGGDTWFSSNTTVMAKGGTGVALNTTTGGQGGQASASVGDLTRNGGNGGTGSGPAGSCSASGGGGGGAGSTGAGNPGGNGVNGGGLCLGGGTGGAGGAARAANGGAGGAGASSGGVGTAGSLYGGGGGGAKSPNIIGGNQNGGAGARGMIRIRVVTTSVAPTSITGTSTICSGSSTTLTASGGTVGSGAVIQWFSGSCGGTSAGTGSSITVSPTSTTTYYVRYSGTCNTTTCASVTVTVDQPSTAPTAITGTGTYCHGNSVTLTQSGGALGGSASYQWFTGSCGGTPAGTGSSITISPTSTQTYYVRASANGTCPATACASGTITLPTPGTDLGQNGDNSTCVVNQSGWVHFYESGSGRLLASVNSQGQDLGNVTVTSYVDAAPALVPACDYPTYPEYMTSVMERHWVITPTIQPTTPVLVRLPFYSTEYTTLAAAANANGNSGDNISAITDVLCSKYSGPLNVDNDAPNNCVANGGSGGTTIYSQTSNGNVTTYAPTIVAASSFADFTIPGFSEFWLHGSLMNSPLPVTLTTFTADCSSDGSEVRVRWSTVSEQNSQEYVVERSTNGNDWTEIGSLNAAGYSTANINYSLLDNEARGHSTLYYRLQQIDQDGKSTEYGPTTALCQSDVSGFALQPNPATDNVSVVLFGDLVDGNTVIHMFDVEGKEILSRIYREASGQVMEIDITQLNPGVYIVKMVTDGVAMEVRRLIKQ